MKSFHPFTDTTPYLPSLVSGFESALVHISKRRGTSGDSSNLHGTLSRLDHQPFHRLPLLLLSGSNLHDERHAQIVSLCSLIWYIPICLSAMTD